jgi:hypothetical protein
MVACPWGVMDLKVEFQETKTPPGETALGVGKVEDPLQRVVVSTDNKPVSLQIGSEVEDTPHYSQTFLLCSRVVTLRAHEATTPLSHRMVRAIGLGLEKAATDLVL